MRQIDLYFDFMSPFAYLAERELSRIARQYDCIVNYKVIDLAKAKLAVGNDGPSNRDLPIKLRYLMTDLGRWADKYGMPLNPVKNHNSHRLNLGTFYAIDQGQAERYVKTAYHHTWGQAGAPDNEALQRAVAKELGWNDDEFIRYIHSAEAEERYDANNREAADKGVFGVPTIMIGNQMWWGNDRLSFVEEYLEADR